MGVSRKKTREKILEKIILEKALGKRNLRVLFFRMSAISVLYSVLSAAWRCLSSRLAEMNQLCFLKKR